MINKNDCFDCDNCVKEYYSHKGSKWTCKIPGNKVPEHGVLDGDCPDFKYSE